MNDLNFVPFTMIETQEGMILKRGRIEVLIGGKGSVQVMQRIVDYVKKNSPSKEEIYNLFPSHNRESISNLLDELIKRRFLVPKYKGFNEEEDNLDVFYWHFADNTKEINNRLNSNRLMVVGLNNISLQLVNSLKRSGISNFEILDYPVFSSISRNDQAWSGFTISNVDFKSIEERINSKEIGCIISTSDAGKLRFMRRWNELCVKLNCTFLPIVLKDLIGYVGPITVPNETACFDCFLTRMKANNVKIEVEFLDEPRILNDNYIVGYHPSMASILGDIAVMELVKFYADWRSIFNVGRLIKVNMLASTMDVHKVLRLPRCRTCSPLNSRLSINLHKRPML